MTWNELRAEAFGEMGVNPTDFYDMEREDFWLMKEGFFKRRVNDQRVLRRMVMTIISPHIKGDPSPFNVLPLPLDKELQQEIREYNKKRSITVSAETMARLQAIKEKAQKKPKDN